MTQKIEQLIEQANSYFITKMRAGEFDMLNITESTIEIQIDDAYKFTLWFATDVEFFRQWDSGKNCMILSFSDEDKYILHNFFQMTWKQHRKDVRAKQIEALKAELEQIEEEENADS